jgi:pimeloyl-ACP methyl ester carboxylesterase
MFSMALGKAYAEDPQLNNPWIRHAGSANAQGVIVFVHGVLGNAKSSWSSNESFWPELITRDTAFNGQDVYVYKYPSPLFGKTFSIDDVADNLRLVLVDEGIPSYGEMTIVSHSMGGLITRSFLLKNRQFVPKIRLLYFFATPTTGSPYARLASALSGNWQFKNMYPMNPDSYVSTLQGHWLSAHFELKSYCAFETQPLFGQMIIVDRSSATNLCTERLDPIDADHISIVKPLNSQSTAYRALKVAFIEAGVKPTPKAIPVVRTEPQEKRLDGLSGNGHDWGAWYTLCTDDKPVGWTIIKSSFHLEGDRQCPGIPGGGWAQCEAWGVDSATKVCRRFQMQGHDEAKPGVRPSTGVLTVVWQYTEMVTPK